MRYALIAIGIALGLAPVAVAATPSYIQHFFAQTQSAYYVGSNNPGNTPEFVAGKSMEFEFLACNTGDEKNSPLTGLLHFGDGNSRDLGGVPCDPVIIPYTYAKPHKDTIIVLEITDASGASDIKAIKIDVVPMPSLTRRNSAGSVPLAPTMGTATPSPSAVADVLPGAPGAPSSSVSSEGNSGGSSLAEAPAGPPSATPGPGDSTNSVLVPGSIIPPGQKSAGTSDLVSTESASASSTTGISSPILGVFITGVLVLFFLTTLVFGIRWLLAK